MEIFRFLRSQRRVEITEDDLFSALDRLRKREPIPDQSGTLGMFLGGENDKEINS